MTSGLLLAAALLLPTPTAPSFPMIVISPAAVVQVVCFDDDGPSSGTAFRVDGDAGPYLPIDCDGFVKDRKYLAVGFARGEAPVTVIELTSTGKYDHRQALLEGMLVVIPGQSGGPIIDEETGKVVGVINAEDFEDGLSWSVELKSTPVCQRT